MDITVETPADDDEVLGTLSELATRLPHVLLCSTQLPSPVGDRHSALADAASIRTERLSTNTGSRIWLKLYYDPVVSYAERIREQLKSLSEAGKASK